MNVMHRFYIFYLVIHIYQQGKILEVLPRGVLETDTAICIIIFFIFVSASSEFQCCRLIIKKKSDKK